MRGLVHAARPTADDRDVLSAQERAELALQPAGRIVERRAATDDGDQRRLEPDRLTDVRKNERSGVQTFPPARVIRPPRMGPADAAILRLAPDLLGPADPITMCAQVGARRRIANFARQIRCVRIAREQARNVVFGQS